MTLPRTWVTPQGSFHAEHIDGSKPVRLTRWNTHLDQWTWVNNFATLDDAIRWSYKKRPKGETNGP